MALNKNLKILLYGGNIWYFAEGMLGPLFAVFTERIGGGHTGCHLGVGNIFDSFRGVLYYCWENNRCL